MVTFSFQAIYQDPKPIHGHALANGTFTGAIGRLLTNESDLCLSTFFIRDYGIAGIDFTTPIYQDQLCVVVQKADIIPEAVLPLLTFDVASWICILLSLIGCSIFWIVLRIINANRSFVESLDQLYMMQSYSDYLHIVVDTGILFMSSPLMRSPKIWSERIFVISICLMSIILIAYFQSILATVFVNPLYYRDIKSLGELEESRLPIEIDLQLAVDLLFDEKSSLVERVNIVNSSHCLSYIAEYGNLSTVLRETSIKFNYAHWFRLKKLYQIPYCPRTFMTAFILPKQSVYFEPINQILIRLIRGGFIQKWISDTMFNMTLANTRLYGSLDERNYVVLQLVDMQFPFVVLICGCVLSSFVFIGEICTYETIIEF